MSVAALRMLAFSVPAVALLGAVWASPRTPRVLGALLLAFTWNLGTLPLVNAAAQRLGGWTFEAEGGLLLGAPFDVLLGWAFLWGPVALVVSRHVPRVLVVLGALFVDWWLMPALHPLLQLGDRWLLGEAVLLGVCLLPALLFGGWTWDDRRLPGRVVLHLLQFGLVIGWLLPHSVLVHTGGSWQPLLDLPAPAVAVVVQVGFWLTLPGLAAVMEFAERGGGTPVPFDGPKRLVASGPYAYVRNPMQVATAIGFVGLGVLLQSPWVAAIGGMAVVYGAGLAAWHERSGDLDARFGAALGAWRDAVPAWRVRWRPHVAEPATLWVAETCAPCRAVGAWIGRRGPVGLRLAPAEQHPTALRRMRYEAGDGHAEDGLSALARALEHVNLGWAWLGFAMRLPVVRQVLRVLVDASGGGPRDLPAR